MFVTRVALVLTVAANLAVGPGFAPEHVHERDEHHRTATVHRHVAAHLAQRSDAPTRFDHGDDDHVVWLTAAWLQTATYAVPAVASIPAPIFVRPPLDRGWTALVFDEAAPPHGPPRSPRSLRAPPFPA